GALDEALAGLVSIAHEGEAPASFPRSVRARYEELRARGVRVELGAELATSRSSDANERGFGVVAVVADDPGHLVRRTRVRARAAGGEWRELTPSDRIALPGDRARDADVEYVVEGLGPGGSVIATYGTEERPIEAVVEGIPPDETPMIVGLVVGGAAIVAGIVVTLAAAIATDGFRDGMTTVIGPTSAGVPLIRF
ncbi:MAG: hypothetical protein IT378_25085, partial [Sandaracinaceae bacterium]|nr:hypothetical protein [Sandaracinaceae bacterium]